MITANLTVLALHSFRNYDRNLMLNKRGKLPFDRRKKTLQDNRFFFLSESQGRC